MICDVLHKHMAGGQQRKVGLIANFTKAWTDLGFELTANYDDVTIHDTRCTPARTIGIKQHGPTHWQHGIRDMLRRAYMAKLVTRVHQTADEDDDNQHHNTTIRPRKDMNGIECNIHYEATRGTSIQNALFFHFKMHCFPCNIKKQ